MHQMYSTIDNMHKKALDWEQTEDQRCTFLKCYALMSSNVADAVKQGRFIHSEWVSDLMVNFAEYYFNALDKYESELTTTPPVWKYTHDITLQSDKKVVRNLILGVNAHINYDLPLTLYDCLKDEWAALDEISKKSRLSDHLLINQVITNTIDSVQDSIISPQSRIMAVMDKAMGRIDEWFISGMISGWRQDVWDCAVTMLNAHDRNSRDEIVRKLEQRVINKAYTYSKIGV